MVQIVNPDGTVANTSGNFGSGLYLPEVKEQMFGAFGDIENQTQGDNTFGVYQLQTNPLNIPREDLQRFYGSSQMPALQFVSLIQTGQRKFDPTSKTDQDLLSQYEDLYNMGEVPPGFKTPEEIAKEVAIDVTVGAVGAAGAGVGRALADPYFEGQDANLSSKIFEGAKTGLGFGELPSERVASNLNLSETQLKFINKNNLFYDPELANVDTAKATGRYLDFTDIGGLGDKQVLGTRTVFDPATKTNIAQKVNLDQRVNIGTKDNPLYAYRQRDLGKGISEGRSRTFDATVTDVPVKSGFSRYTSEVGERLTSPTNVSASVGAGTGAFVTDLILTKGKDPVKSAKKGVGAGAGYYIGNALLPGFGGQIGAAVGAKAGGRVICNELSRQKLMSRQQVVLDYKFTREYLTPTHVNGYHIWAVWMVKQMRKGRFVKFWKHVAGHRANEIAYIYNKKDKPDYLGKIYRKILEPICYGIGLFCKKTDWSVLYTKKEM